MSECFERGPDFDALVETMRRPRRPLALLGAGTSVDSGYPDWNRLLGILESKATGLISHKYGAFLRTLNDPAWQAEEYRRIIGEHAFCGVIASEFGPRGAVGGALRVVAQLGFRHLLTTNYDACIERAYEEQGTRLRVLDWAEDANLRQFFLDLAADPADPHLLYLHGRYYDPAKIILTESSYASRYVRSDDARSKLFAIFLTQPVVFIGFSVNDPDFNHLMREVNARLGMGKPQHFALIGYEVEEQQQLIRSRFLGKYGIAPVFYRITRNPDGTESHRCLVELLAAVHHAAHGRAPTLVAAPAAPQAPVPGSEDTPALLLDPLDQQKGRWGGHAERNGRVLRLRRLEESEKHPGEALAFDLVVEPSDGGLPLSGEVIFHLHQTFPKQVQTVTVEDGRAVLRITAAYGAFTVGAQADGGSTQLELDLAQDPQLPEWFRAR